MATPTPIQIQNEAEENPEFGDRGWFGVKMQYQPHQVPSNYAHQAINMRFNRGVPEPRKGVIFLPWLQKLSGGVMQPWGTLYGLGSFRDPFSRIAYTLVAADGNVYACTTGNVPQQIALPVGVTITARCRFVQCFNVVLILRGPDFPVLQMTNINTGFRDVVQTADRLNPDQESGDGTFTIPNCLRGLNANNRLFVIQEDQVLASDQLDYTRFSPLKEMLVNDGSEDRLQNIEMFGKATMVCGKEKSVYRVDNVYGNLAASVLSRVTKRYGVTAPDTMVDTGTDFVWLSQEGVASLTLTQQNEIQAAQGLLQGKWPMFSDDIEPLIRRINWQYAGSAQAAFNGGRLYMAVPLDAAEVLRGEFLTGMRYTTPQIQTAQTGLGASFDPNLLFFNSFFPVGSVLDLAHYGIIRITAAHTDQDTPLIEGRHYSLDRRFGKITVLPAAAADVGPDGQMTGTEWIFTYDVAAVYSLTIAGLTAGATYRFVPGTHDCTLTNGAVETSAAVDFVAAGTTVTMKGGNFGSPDFTSPPYYSNLSDGSLRRIHKGVNNAVLVFDTKAGPNGAWAGHDESNEISVRQWLLGDYLNRERLFFLDADGWLKLYEEDEEDQLSEPYTDWHVDYDLTTTVAPPALSDIGLKFLVNGGTTITTADAVNNSGSNWGLWIVDPGTGNEGAALNLLKDSVGNGGYEKGAISPWSAPNTYPLRLLGDPVTTASGTARPVLGVRFRGLNGVPPVVYTKLGTGGFGDATFVNPTPVGKVLQVTRTPILATLITREYGTQDMSLERFNWLYLDLQTLNPEYSLDLLGPGVNRVQNLSTNKTKSRTRYYRPFDAADWDPSNVNDDWDTPYREDYSLACPDFSAEQMGPKLGNGDLRLAEYQEVREPFHFRFRGRGARVRLTITRGRVRVIAAKFSAMKEAERGGV